MNKIDKMNVIGLAIKQGISRNGIKYIAEELEKFAPTLVGCNIQKDHSPSIDASVGKITDATYEDKGAKVLFKGWVKNDNSNLIEKIEDGRISKVSIGAIAGKLIKEKEDDPHMIAKDLHSVELSLVVVPGVVGASISQALESVQQNKVDSKIKIKSVREVFDYTETEDENYDLTEDETKNIQASIDSKKTESMESKEEIIVKTEEIKQESVDTSDIQKIDSDIISNSEVTESVIENKEDKSLVEDAKMSEDENKTDAVVVVTESKVSAQEEKAPSINVEELVEKISETFSAQLKPIRDEITKLKEDKVKEVKETKSEFKSSDVTDKVKEAFSAGEYCVEKEKGALSLFRMPDAHGNLM